MPVTKEEEIDYEKDIYAKWEQLGQTKLMLDDGTGGESIWCRKLPDGTIGIDNNPLTGLYRWQDIVENKPGMPKLLYRRWNSKIWFKYTPDDNDSADRALRQKIYKKIEEFGNVNFFFKGLGYILMKEYKDAQQIIEAALADLDFITDIEDPDAKLKMSEGSGVGVSDDPQSN